jgi:hypothetical protein
MACHSEKKKGGGVEKSAAKGTAKAGSKKTGPKGSDLRKISVTTKKPCYKQTENPPGDDEDREGKQPEEPANTNDEDAPVNRLCQRVPTAPTQPQRPTVAKQFSVRRILAENNGGGKSLYLVDWHPTRSTGAGERGALNDQNSFKASGSPFRFSDDEILRADSSSRDEARKPHSQHAHCCVQTMMRQPLKRRRGPGR